MKIPPWLRFSLGLAVLVTGAWILRTHIPPCEVLRARVSEGGRAEIFFYLLFCVLFTVFFIPGTVMALVAGVAYGPWVGTVLANLGAVLGALLAFAISRYLARDLVEKWLARRSWYAKFRQTISENQFSVLLFLRLSPLFPFNALNYACGVAEIRFRDYLITSLIGMLPGSFAYVYFGASLGCSRMGATKLPPAALLPLVLLSLLSLIPLAFRAKRRATRDSK